MPSTILDRSLARGGGFPEIVTGADSTHVKAIYHVPVDAAVTIYPTAAGVANVYVSVSPATACETDVAGGHITSGNTAQWEAWPPGAVSALKSQVTFSNISAIAVVAASGTWTLEVCR